VVFAVFISMQRKKKSISALYLPTQRERQMRSKRPPVATREGFIKKRGRALKKKSDVLPPFLYLGGGRGGKDRIQRAAELKKKKKKKGGGRGIRRWYGIRRGELWVPEGGEAV